MIRRAVRRSDWICLIGFAALLCASLFVARQIEIDNRLESWIDAPAEDQRRYDQLRATFGSDEFVLIAVTGPRLFDAEALDAQLEAVEEIEALPSVHHVLAAAVLYRDVFGAEDPEELLEELRATDFYRGLLISNDDHTAGLFVVVDPPHDARARRNLLEGIEEAVHRLEDLGNTVRLVGPPVLTRELDTAALAEARRSLPLAVAASLLLLGVLLRSLRATLVAIACSATTIGLVLGFIALLGRPLNMFTAALPALLWVLSLAAILHILVRYRHELATKPAPEALQHALQRARFPCVLSSVTTAAGFLSLNFAPMRPVRELGSLTGLGILVSLGVSFALGPSLIRLLQPEAVEVKHELTRLARLSTKAFAKPVRVLVPFVAITIAGVFSISSIRLNTNPLEFLPSKSKVLRDYQGVVAEIGAGSSIELLLPTPTGWVDRDVWLRLEAIEEALRGEPDVAKVRTPLNLLKKLNEWNGTGRGSGTYALPETAEAAQRLLADVDPVFQPELSSLVAKDGLSVRLSLLVTAMDSEPFSNLEGRIRTLVVDTFGHRASVTGIVPLIVQSQRRLIRSQLQSISLTVLVIFLCVWIGQRSSLWALITMIPNLVPVATVFLLMAVLDLALDPGTIMVAGVALGIAVDDTVHLITSLRRHGGELPAAVDIHNAVAEVGPALLVTTAAATAGFISLTVAHFLPIRYFGLLTSVAMVVALAAALFLLPALLGVRYHRRATAVPSNE